MDTIEHELLSLRKELILHRNKLDALRYALQDLAPEVINKWDENVKIMDSNSVELQEIANRIKQIEKRLKN